jgi:acetyltransferase-like isoleucine patch superfamily enzyme
MGFLTDTEVKSLGFAFVGENVRFSDKASYYNCGQIRVSSNTRIDDFCVISAGEGGINIGSHVHLAIGVSLIGAGNITLCDFSNLSSRVSIYSSNDDYTGQYMTNPTVPSAFTNVTSADVYIGRHVIVGSGAVILPGVRLEDGVAVGALSLVNKSCEAFSIYAGNPAKFIKPRKKDLLILESKFKNGV